MILVRSCHELSVPEELLDGYPLENADQVRTKVAQLAASRLEANKVGRNAVLSAGRLPGSGNVPDGRPAPIISDPTIRMMNDNYFSR